MGIGYTTIGAKDSEASGKFYDAVFGAIGDERKFADGGWIGYGAIGPDKGFTGCHTMVTGKPNNGKDAQAGNGIMIAYKAPSADAVKKAYEGGMANGGSDEGKPGFRPPEATAGFYATYLRDPTGNKICVFAVITSGRGPRHVHDLARGSKRCFASRCSMAASAACALPASGPPAWAMSGRPPPPLPPRASAASRTRSTALMRAVRSSVTPTTIEALPSAAATKATTPEPICALAPSARLLRSLGDTPSTSAQHRLDAGDGLGAVIAAGFGGTGQRQRLLGFGQFAFQPAAFVGQRGDAARTDSPIGVLMRGGGFARDFRLAATDSGGHVRRSAPRCGARPPPRRFPTGW